MKWSALRDFAMVGPKQQKGLGRGGGASWVAIHCFVVAGVDAMTKARAHEWEASKIWCQEPCHGWIFLS